MAFNAYTSCSQAQNHSTLNQYVQATIQALLATGIGALFVAAAGLPWCLLLLIEIGPFMWILGFCHWWLEDRLICLGGDRVAIGMLVSTEPGSGKSGFEAFDTDFSINLLPAANPIGAVQATVEVSVPYGILVKEQQATHDIGVPFTGFEMVTDKPSGLKCAVLHAEFEGAGIQDLLTGTQIAFGLAVTALIVCLGIPGPIGALIAVILAVLAFLALLFGGLIGLSDKGSPGDVNPSLGDLHTNDPTTGLGADLLVVMGRWIYDAGHNNENRGWNELHPIKFCERIGQWKGAWPADIQDLKKRWEIAIGEATAPATIAGQKNPENHWQVHPLIDGCRPAGTPPDLPPIH